MRKAEKEERPKRFESVIAKLAVRHPEETLSETGAKLTVTAPDYLAITGTLTGGAPATVLYRSGTSRGTDLRWEIAGAKGKLLITADSNGNIQNTELKLKGGHKAKRRRFGSLLFRSIIQPFLKIFPKGLLVTATLPGSTTALPGIFGKGHT